MPIAGSENLASKAIYYKANEFIEKWSKYTYFAMFKVTLPCVTITSLVVCYFLYFTTNLKSDAFHLPFLTW